MAISTDNGKLALMEYGDVFHAAAPIPTVPAAASFTEGDKNQLLWEYPEIAFGDPSAEEDFGPQKLMLMGAGL